MLTDTQLVETLKKAAEQHQGDIPLSFLLQMAAERVETLSRIVDES